ncbi:GNAT family N-acetyltransferase [Loktanella sp. IMCC34160]|uniref:GNAT family N-acetyltransferase n=1 Tax=Loktanella sp. IMCC34160 TaxID=2510646 RepID=UPI00101B8828|nr:GNAT family N-acetyltransferase [Loktanella sp. IMCC34160]RYG90452.1 GNAT family N-acetyltransferase [Loktanella sp. IMCC34160]
MTDGPFSFAIRHGLPDEFRAQAAALYWAAFRDKLGRVMGPDQRATGFISRVLDPDHALCAIGPDGDLLGVIGFKSPKGAFVGGSFRDFVAVYGMAGAALRVALIWRLQSDIENERFLIDGLIVAPHMRGRGVGTALLRAMRQEAGRRGYHELRLEVADGNDGARALYDRLGFRDIGWTGTGALRHVFGFRGATTMVWPVSGP